MHRRHRSPYNSNYSREQTYRAPSPPHFPRGRKRERSPPHYSENRYTSPHYRPKSRSPPYFKKRTDSPPGRFDRSQSPRHHHRGSSYDYSERRSPPRLTSSRGRSRSKSPPANSSFDYYDPYLNRDDSPPRFVKSDSNKFYSDNIIYNDNNNKDQYHNSEEHYHNNEKHYHNNEEHYLNNEEHYYNNEEHHHNSKEHHYNKQRHHKSEDGYNSEQSYNSNKQYYNDEERHHNIDEHEDDTSRRKSNEFSGYSATQTIDEHRDGISRGKSNEFSGYSATQTIDEHRDGISRGKSNEFSGYSATQTIDEHRDGISRGKSNEFSGYSATQTIDEHRDGISRGKSNEFSGYSATQTIDEHRDGISRGKSNKFSGYSATQTIDEHENGISREKSNEFSGYSATVTSKTANSDRGYDHTSRSFIKSNLADEFTRNHCQKSTPAVKKLRSFQELAKLTEAELQSFPLPNGGKSKLRYLLKDGMSFADAKRSIIKGEFMKLQYTQAMMTRNPTMRNRTLEQVNNMSSLDIEAFHLTSGLNKEVKSLTEKGLPYMEAKHRVIKGFIQGLAKGRQAKVGSMKKIPDKITYIEEADELPAEEIQSFRLSLPSNARLDELVAKGIPYIEAKRIIIKQNFTRYKTFKLDKREAKRTKKLTKIMNKLKHSKQNVFTDTKPGYIQPRTPTVFQGEISHIPSYEKSKAVKKSIDKSRFSWVKDQQSTSVSFGGSPESSTRKRPDETASRAEIGSSEAAMTKQIKYFLSLGMPLQEAEEKAWKDFNKPFQLDEHCPKIQVVPKAHASQCNPEPSVQQVQAPATTQNRIVGVIHSRHPEKFLTVEHLDSIEESLTEQIITSGLARPDIQPSFLSVKQKPGWLAVECGDFDTVTWLKSIAKNLEPEENVTIKIMEESEIPRKDAVVSYLPHSLEYTNEKIVSLLEVQNQIKLSLLFRYNLGGNTTKVTFEADPKLVEELEKRKFRLNYKFGTVKLKYKKI